MHASAHGVEMNITKAGGGSEKKSARVQGSDAIFKRKTWKQKGLKKSSTAQSCEEDAREPSREELTTLAKEIENDEQASNGAGDAWSQTVFVYLASVRKEKLLSAEEERILAAKNEKGDAVSRERLIVCNLRLVVKIAKRYMGRGLELIDLIEEGNIGLIKAIDRFRTSKECRVSTYATWWIRQSIELALAEQTRIIHVPRHIYELAGKRKRYVALFGGSDDSIDFEGFVEQVLADEVSRYRKRRGSEPDQAAMEYLWGEARKHVRVSEQVELQESMLSMDHPFDRVNGGETLANLLEDQQEGPDTLACWRQLVERELPKALGVLTKTEHDIIDRRFGLTSGDKAEKFAVIKEDYGVTVERVRQIEAGALKKMRNCICVA